MGRAETTIWSSDDYEQMLTSMLSIFPHGVYTRGGNIASRRQAMNEGAEWCEQRLGDAGLYCDTALTWHLRKGAAWAMNGAEFRFRDADTAFEFKLRFG